MKKTIAILICLMLVLCVACGDSQFSDDVTCEQILNAAIKVESYDNTQAYTPNGTKLDKNLMSMWSDGVFAECEEFDLISDYAICYSTDNTTYEISVLKAKSSADVSKIEALYERHKQTLEAGTKAAYDPNFKKIMADSKIIADGNFVILLITNDNDAVIEAINELK